MADHVAVIGAGIVGLSLAISLRERGVDVTVFDPQVPGTGASAWNAGVLATSSLIPLPNPWVFAKLPRLLTGRQPGFRLSRKALPSLLPWTARFLLASRQSAFDDTTAVLHDLISRSRQRHATLMARAGCHDLVRELGWLWLFRSLGAAQAMGPMHAIYARHGVENRVVSPSELRDLEPALQPNFAQALLFPGTASVIEPARLLHAYLALAIDLGAAFVPLRVESVDPQTDRGPEIRLADGTRRRFDHVVVAAGAMSASLLPGRRRLPLASERGYVRRFAMPGQPLTRPVYDIASGLVLSPRPDGVQVSTGTELTTPHQPPSAQPAFLRAIERSRDVVELGAALGPDVTWADRPSLPDGLPALGPIKKARGVWLATGHQHIGFSTGPASAEIVADLILGRPPVIDSRPFLPSRFGL